jgi:hypothetical protein
MIVESEEKIFDFFQKTLDTKRFLGYNSAHLKR